MALPIKDSTTATIPSNFKSTKIGNTTITTGNVRVLRMKPKDGGAKSSTGLVDNRLFTGENELNAQMDMESCLWHLKQKIGAVDPKLRDKRWTSFRMLYNDVVTYYANRNVEITEVNA